MSLNPEGSYSDTFTDDDEVNFSTELSAEVGFDYRYQPLVRLGTLNELELVQTELRDVQREGVEAALVTHAELLFAQLELQGEEADVEEAAAQLAVAQAQMASSSPALQRLNEQRLAEARLELEQLTLSRGAARRTLDELGAAAARYGLRAPAVYRPLRFALPDGAAVETSAYRLLDLAVARAQTRLEQQPFQVLGEVQLSAGYDLPEVGVEAAVGIFDRDPGASVGLTYPGARSPRWEISLSAEITLDESTFGGFDEAARVLREAEAARRAFVADFRRELAGAHAGVSFAEKSLALAESRLRLGEGRGETLEEAVQALRTELESADEEALRDLEGQLQDVERELSRAPGERDALEEGLYGAWLTYLDEVGNYLALTGGTWVAR